MTMAMPYFLATACSLVTVGPGTGSAASYQRTACDGQKYKPLKISCRQRICTPFLPASSIIGRCFSNMADWISVTLLVSSLIGFEHWISPHFTVLAILVLHQNDRMTVGIGQLRAPLTRTVHRHTEIA